MNFLKKAKGKIIVVGVAFLLGIPAVVGSLGIEIVDGPEGAVCFAEVKSIPTVIVAE